jgi:EmrB/QacA subfamily drug resistance transporter
MGITEHRSAERARWIALAVVCLAQLMSIVDVSIVNVALPSIQRSLHFASSNLTWVPNGYLITFGSLLLLGGRIGDLIGRRQMFLVGVAVFTAASALCGLAESQTVLIVARLIQGAGGAAASSAIMAIITTEFTEPGERARAMSIYMLIISAGGSIGLLAGGVITQLLNWHWIFFVNVPVGVATLVLGRIWIADKPGIGVGRNLDIAGPVLVTAGMVAAVYAIVTSATHGWGSVHTLAFGGAAVAMLAAFVFVEARHPDPIMPLRIFAIPGIAGSSVVRGLLMAGMYSTFFIGVLYLQHVRGYGTLETGLAFLPQTLTLSALSLGATARIVRRFGPKLPTLVGTLLCGVALALMLRLGVHSSYAGGVLVPFVLFGLGAGLAMMPLLTIAMANVKPGDAGMASGIVNTSLQLSGAFAIAVLGTVASDRTRTLLSAGATQAHALVGGYHLAFGIGTGCIAAGLLFALVWWGAPRVRETIGATRPEPSERAL